MLQQQHLHKILKLIEFRRLEELRTDTQAVSKKKVYLSIILEAMNTLLLV